MRIITIFLCLFVNSPLFAQWSTENMSVEKRRVEMTQANDKLFFVGEPSEIVDIYNIATDEWSTTSLPDANTHNFLTSFGDEIFVAGYRNSSPFYSGRMQSFNTETNEWTRIDFPNVGDATGLTSVDHLIFAVDDSYLDIYDAIAKTWTSMALSESRIIPHLVNCNKKVFVAGGGFTFGTLYSLVDVYDTEDGSFSSINMSISRNSLKSACVENKVYFIGGKTVGGDTPIIDVYDTESDSWEILNLSKTKSSFGIAAHGNSIYIGGGIDDQNNILNEVEIINTSDQSVSFEELSVARFNIGGYGFDDKVYFAGGNPDVFELSTVVDVLQLSTSSVDQKPKEKEALTVFPNPAQNYIQFEQSLSDFTKYAIHDHTGKLIQKGIVYDEKIGIEKLHSGFYIIKINGELTAKFLKI